MSEQLAIPVALQRGRPVGWWAVALLVATEGALFGVLVASTFYIRFRTPHWPPLGDPHPKVLAPALLTALLVSSSATAALAARSARRGLVANARTGLATTAAFGALYAGGTLTLLIQAWHGAPATKDAFESLTFTLQGAHVVHVATGVLVNCFLLGKLARGRLTRYRVNGIWAIALYWHFLNVLAVVVYLVTVLPTL